MGEGGEEVGKREHTVNASTPVPVGSEVIVEDLLLLLSLLFYETGSLVEPGPL